jgi:Protein of unknown function (DUF2510)
MQLSGAQTVVYLILAVLFAFVGYRLSENFRKQSGRTPWGMPSALWAFIWFLSLLLGLVLYLIARSTTKIDPSRRPVPPMSRPGWPAGTSTPAQSDSVLPGRYPSRVFPGNGSPPPAADPSAAPPPDLSAPPPPDLSAPPPPDLSASPPPDLSASPPPDLSASPPPDLSASPPTDPSAARAPDPSAGQAVSPPMWHPDPSGRFEYRWWDGQRWTSSVSRGGVQLDDPIGN